MVYGIDDWLRVAWVAGYAVALRDGGFVLERKGATVGADEGCKGRHGEMYVRGFVVVI